MLFITGAARAQSRMTQITNIAAYKFVALDRLAERREAMQDKASSLGLKGTILLAE